MFFELVFTSLLVPRRPLSSRTATAPGDLAGPPRRAPPLEAASAESSFFSAFFFFPHARSFLIECQTSRILLFLVMACFCISLNIIGLRSGVGLNLPVLGLVIGATRVSPEQPEV